MRSGWNSDDRYLIIDGGLAKDKPDHTHGGILGLIAYGYGTTLLPNYRVRYADSSYPTMKNSLAKNVVIVDGILQGRGWIPNAARTGFGKWNYLPKPSTSAWMTGDVYDIYSGTHDGFDTIGLGYSRTVVFVKPFFWIVLDQFSGEGSHTYEQIWQGDYTIDSRPGFITAARDDAGITIVQHSTKYMTAEKRQNYQTKSLSFIRRGQPSSPIITALYPWKEERPAIKCRDISTKAFSGAEFISDSSIERVYVSKKGEINTKEFTARCSLAIVSLSEHQKVISACITDLTYMKLPGFEINSDSSMTVQLKEHQPGRWKVATNLDTPQNVMVACASKKQQVMFDKNSTMNIDTQRKTVRISTEE
jgi:hypothetical protein